jgi:hypothetical protein
MKKWGKTVLLASLFVALGAIAWEVLPVAYFIVMIAMDPAGCDEGPVTGGSSTNTRGDVVQEYIKVCTGFGSFADYSIVLQLHGNEKPTTLVEDSDPQQDYPKFRWLDDDSLMIDLGKVSWLQSQVHKARSIKITYVYSMGE